MDTSAAVVARGAAGCAGRAIDCGASDDADAALAKRTLRVTERRQTLRQCDSYGDQPQSI